jgi:hypothetical protein
MRAFLCISWLVLGWQLTAQVSDNFSDGDFTKDPTWTGDTASFEVNSALQLHLKGAGTDTAWLTTIYQSSMATCWKFWVKLSLNTSQNNYARIYLNADQDHLDQPINSYFIQIGGADDSIRFIQQTGISLVSLCCIPGFATNHTQQEMRFNIFRDTSGIWSVRIDTTGGSTYITAGVFTEKSLMPGGWLGVWCKYTASNASRFYFDDFYAGPPTPDTLPPGSSDSIRMFDVLIHEILCDPEPTVALPPYEYVELFNRTDSVIRLEDWIFEYGSSQRVFPPVSLEPKGYLLISGEDFPADFGPAVPLFTSGNSLSNETVQLTLRDKHGQIIHAVECTSGWYGGSWKEEGGWSLEMADISNPCGCGENWKASTDPAGGTPGRENSVKGAQPDLSPPEVVRSCFSGQYTWFVYFSETIDPASVGSPEEWEREPGEKWPDSVIPVSPAYRTIRLVFSEEFLPDIIYRLTGTSRLTDCAGNTIQGNILTRSALPEPVDPGDIVLNEVLSHPFPEGSPFIELLNLSDKVLNLEELAFLVADTGETVSSADVKILISSPYLIFPDEYTVVCKSRNNIISNYITPNPNHFLEMTSFPSMNYGAGQVILLRSADEMIIDQMVYRENMHYPLLGSTIGVSLERIRPDKLSLDPMNWHSASGIVGYATPAYRNSQTLDPGEETTMISINPEVFSPDNDGKNDVMTIQYNLDRQGFQGSVIIFDSRGRMIRQLISNELVGQHGELLWDGISEDRRKPPLGIYLIYMEFVHPDGEVKRLKKTVVIAEPL